MSESQIYLDDNGNYRDKGESWVEPDEGTTTETGTDEPEAPMPDAPDQNPDGEALPAEPKTTAKTRKQ